MSKMHRFVRVPNAIEQRSLVERGEGGPIVELVEQGPELTNAEHAIDELLSEWDELTARDRTKSDGALGPLLREALPMTRRAASDMRMWHWACTMWEPGRRYANARWGKTVSRRFGTNTQGGIARNALARLWWGAETLRVDADYSLASEALSQQDKFVGIFERYIATYPVVIRGVVRAWDGLDTEDMRDLTKHFNRIGATTALEAMTEERVIAEVEMWKAYRVR